MPLRLPPWESLSADEQIPIANLPLDQNYLITGGPGTGKTILALYRASRLKSKYDDEKNVMFLVYNKTLRKYLEQAIKEVGLDQSSVANWHQWFYKKYYDEFNHFVPESSKYNPDWDEILKEWKEQKLFDHLILDESQDLPHGLHKLLKRSSKNYTVFADDNQSINEYGSNIAEISNAYELFERRYPLTKNYRNTVEIASVSNLFYTGDPANVPPSSSKKGEKPIIFYINSGKDFNNYIANFADNSPEKNIGVIIPRINKLNTIYNELHSLIKIATIQKYTSNNDDHFDFSIDGLKILTFDSAKGLEFDAVFVPDIDSTFFDSNEKSDINKIYVCCSRAKENLYFSYSNKNSSSFALKKFKENEKLLDWQDLGEVQIDAAF